MQFEWDEAKNQINIRKHGIDFADVPSMFEGEILSRIDDRFDYGEERWVGIGFIQQGVAVVVWTERHQNTIRIISARKANHYERRQFEIYISN